MYPLVFDIETKDTFADVGSHDPSKLSPSMVCVYSYREGKFFSFTEHELGLLWPHLDVADVLVGFNNIHFDLPVLSRHYPGDIMRLQMETLRPKVLIKAREMIREMGPDATSQYLLPVFRRESQIWN